MCTYILSWNTLFNKLLFLFSCTTDIDCLTEMVCDGRKNYCRLKSDNSDSSLCLGIACREGEGGCRSDSECDGSLVCGTDNCAFGPSNMDCCIGKFDALHTLLCREWDNCIRRVRNASFPYTLHHCRRGPRFDFGSKQQFLRQMIPGLTQIVFDSFWEESKGISFESILTDSCFRDPWSVCRATDLNQSTFLSSQQKWSNCK